jgi:hypothetical protein
MCASPHAGRQPWSVKRVEAAGTVPSWGDNVSGRQRPRSLCGAVPLVAKASLRPPLRLAAPICGQRPTLLAVLRWDAMGFRLSNGNATERQWPFHRPGRVLPGTRFVVRSSRRQPIGYRPIDPRTLVALTHALRLPTGPLSAARAVSIVEMCEGWSTSSSGRSSPPWWRILLGDPRRISSDGQAIAL